ncbi:MAG: insulinase family protein [Bacteroidales bacterium]|nr:insulinase family protein [Bacteroidales bacterium]
MKRTLRLPLLIPALLVSIIVSSQPDLTQPIPHDPLIRTGKLENGLTYFIRNNSEPEKRASFYIIQNVGALLEEDNQNGLAHFLEHMAFNGTKNFPGNAIISTLEKHGVAFGRNINAYTTHNETVYNLSDVPVDKPGLIDTCLLILHDWSDFLLLEEKEIDSERGVIAEEWRTRRNAAFRMQGKFLPVLLNNSQYAVRDVIGDLDVIRNFSYSTLRDFYHKWYRTDLQAIAVVGDFDVDMMEKKIIDLFSQLKPVENPPVRKFFEVPPHNETLYVLAADPEAPQTQISIYIKHEDVKPADRNQGYMRDQIVISLMNTAVSKRIEELLQKGNPPFIAGMIGLSGLFRGYNTFYISAACQPEGERTALEAIYREAERVRRYGFTQGELDRVKAEYLTSFDNYYKQKDKIHNESYISAIQEYFLTGEPMNSIDFENEFIHQVMGGITVRDLNQKFRSLMTTSNRVIIVMGPEKEGITHLTREEATSIIESVSATPVEPYIDSAVGENLIEEPLAGSVITGTRQLPQFEAVEWTLSNNARVIFRKADYEKDEVTLSAFSFGGTSVYDTDKLPSASFMPAIIDAYGTGEFDNITLQKMLSGKKASMTITLGELTEGFSGTSTPKDFETMLQLLYLKFEKPRFDKEAHDAMMSRYKAYLTSMGNDPSKIVQDSLSMILTSYSPRTLLLNPELLEKVSIEEIERIYDDRFSNAGEFTFVIVGNIEADSVKPLVEKYIGSLTSEPRNDTWTDRNVRHPEGTMSRVINIPFTVPKASVYISYSNEIKYNSANNLGLKVIQNILDMVYTEKVREEEGGTYGVSMNISSQLRPRQNGSALIMFDCDPARAEELATIIHNEIDILAKTGPDKEKFDKAVQNLLKNREESKLHNRYWSNTIYAWYYTGIDNNDPQNYEDILTSLKPSDVQKLAKKFFRKADSVQIIFRPE